MVRQDPETGKWILWTADGKRKLGTHATAVAAYKQEYAIQKSQEKSQEKAASEYCQRARAGWIGRDNDLPQLDKQANRMSQMLRAGQLGRASVERLMSSAGLLKPQTSDFLSRNAHKPPSVWRASTAAKDKNLTAIRSGLAGGPRGQMLPLNLALSAPDGSAAMRHRTLTGGRLQNQGVWSANHMQRRAAQPIHDISQETLDGISSHAYRKVPKLLSRQDAKHLQDESLGGTTGWSSVRNQMDTAWGLGRRDIKRAVKETGGPFYAAPAHAVYGPLGTGALRHELGHAKHFYDAHNNVTRFNSDTYRAARGLAKMDAPVANAVLSDPTAALEYQAQYLASRGGGAGARRVLGEVAPHPTNKQHEGLREFWNRINRTRPEPEVASGAMHIARNYQSTLPNEWQQMVTKTKIPDGIINRKAYDRWLSHNARALYPEDRFKTFDAFLTRSSTRLASSMRRRAERYLGPVEKVAAAPLPGDLRRAINQTHTHPTPSQCDAGNYAKGTFQFRPGLTIKIENPEGTTRSGTDKSGKKWSQVMKNTYGYFQRTEGKDGDPVDVFLGPDLDSDVVAVIDQEIDGKFDEHKVVIGIKGEKQAREVYLSNYEKGWKCGPITMTSVEGLKTWLRDGDTKKPFAGWIGRLAITSLNAT